MARILLVGLDPDTVDYSDPALPPGMNAEKVRAGIAVAVNSSPSEDGNRTWVTSTRTTPLARRWRRYSVQRITIAW